MPYADVHPSTTCPSSRMAARYSQRRSRCCPREVTIRDDNLATALASAAIDKKAFDVAILDMEALVDYTDRFVLCTARNRRQVQAIAEEVRKVAKEKYGLYPIGTEGMEAARWVLVDFGSVVVHVFDEPLRGFYDLDRLWGDAKRLPVPASPREEEPMFSP